MEMVIEVKIRNSAEIVGSIDHLLSKILLFLPLKSLFRFKSVSKDWFSLLTTNPIFRNLRNPNPALGLLLPSAQHHHYIPFSAHDFKFTQDHPVKILQSCNGLLLCCSIDLRYYVHNPTTNLFREIPKPDESTGISNPTLAFNPVESRHYQVIRVFSAKMDSTDPHFQIGIYSSESGLWRVCGDPFTALVNFEDGVFWNGGVHWIGVGRGESLYFDVARQVLDKMPMLPLRSGWASRSDYYFGESCDHLHFVGMFVPTFQFNVYEMRRDYSEWFVKYQVDLSPVAVVNSDMIWGRVSPMGWYSLVFSVFTVVRGEHEEDSFLVLQTPTKAIRYNLVLKTFETLHVFEGGVAKGSLKYSGVNVFQYIEYLCCV